MSMDPRFLPSLISFRYTLGIPISFTPSCRIQTSANMACLLITQTQMSLFLVGIRITFKFLLADLVIGWCLFVVAITNDERLRSELTAKVSDRSSDTTIPANVFPVYYDSANGTSLQGVAR